MNDETLWNVTQEIEVEADDYDDDDFKNRIKEAMPDYDVETFDEDEPHAISQVADTIGAMVQGNTIEDYQSCEWCSIDCKLYMYVVAIKYKKDNQ